MPRYILFIAAGLVMAAVAAFFISGENTHTLGANPQNEQQVARGQVIYQKHCASCHGANLEGEPHWRDRRPDGTLPAPPHDETGHTWHHPDQHLFLVTKEGVEAVAPPGYVSAMKGYGDVLSDSEIWDVIAYIKSQWPEEIQKAQKQRNPQ